MRMITAGAVALALASAIGASSASAQTYIYGYDRYDSDASPYYADSDNAYVEPRYYGYRAYRPDRPTRPEDYRTGSSRWWQQMDREDRGGRGAR
jgi:hypothetical protein